MSINLVSVKDFQKRATKLGASIQSMKQEIHTLGVIALIYASDPAHKGNVQPMQMLYAALDKGVDRQAFVAWAQEYGCIRFAKKENSEELTPKFKDRHKDANYDWQGMIAFAETFPYWDFAKEVNPNVKPYDVSEHLRSILAQAKSAETGGSKGDKPKRQVLHKELLDGIVELLANPNALAKLGLTKPSETVVVTPIDELTPDEQAQEEIVSNRGALKAA